ncbi:acyl-CoA Delta-9 desaturase [Anabrus simplex]|uniref:acyl-CoA Delta-9 desaturase n=1 Tax=Anabrus simplex TaxID=316456 RepID=UPI0035A28FB0
MKRWCYVSDFTLKCPGKMPAGLVTATARKRLDDVSAGDQDSAEDSDYHPNHRLVLRMPPNHTSTTDVYSTKIPAETPQLKHQPYKQEIVWRNVISFLYLHLGALYGIYLLLTIANPLTFLWALVVSSMSAVGITAGAHRLWAHRSFKATWQLRLILAVFQTIAFQNHIYEWARDHRGHHKFNDTDADPHNSRRGFFFSHIGWLMVRKHPEVIAKGKTVDMSDLEADPIVMWQKRLYLLLMPLLCFIFPTWVPISLWGERPWVSWYVAGVMRYTLSLNFTWLVNSAAHIWGTRPYERRISPMENVTVAVLAFGEGWHNYHHVFPWDYKAAELGDYRMNFTTAFIDFFARVGWAYDLKTVPVELVRRRAARTGDGTYDGAVWGWDDTDIPSEHVEGALVTHKSD